VQLNLLFRDVPNPSQEVWEQLDETHRGALLEKLAQLMAKAALSEAQREENDHD
jgi:hypothetical protein